MFDVTIIPEVQRTTRISCLDAKGEGGAHHHYLVGPAAVNTAKPDDTYATISFQQGPIQQAGVNGCTNEDLLEIVFHRLECFQAGSHPCDENQQAMVHILEALRLLYQRTAQRRAQGVEGTDQHRNKE